jgi:hypothetical protein
LDGHFAASRAFTCADDDDAIVWAKQLVDGHDIELWSGDRFVIKLEHQLEKKGHLRNRRRSPNGNFGTGPFPSRVMVSGPF